jgi:type II secretory pathway predicted ATPase ExeA
MGMYDTYYGCNREPFSLNPDPSFLYLTARHREALAQLRYVTLEQKGFTVLTGEVGTGKTTILRKFLDEVSAEVTTGYIFNPPRSIDELRASISRELGLGWWEAGPFLTRLNDFLLRAMERNRIVVLIFDEAQALSVEILEEIRLLSNLETGTAKLLQIILAGQPEFNAMLESVELRALRQRVALRCNLEPMSADETVEYIGRRLRVAGAKRSPFTFEACTLIRKYSRGIPRLVNSICSNAMLAGYASDSPIIGRSQVEQAADDLGLKQHPVILGGARGETAGAALRPWGRFARYGGAAAAGVALAAGLSWFAMSPAGRSLYAQRDALIGEVDAFVTQTIDWSLSRVGLDTGVTDPAQAAPAADPGPLTGNDVGDSGAKNEQRLRSTTQSGTGKAVAQETGPGQ